MKDDSSEPVENTDENPKELVLVLSPTVLRMGSVVIVCLILLTIYAKNIREFLIQESTSSLLLGIFLVSEVIQFFILIYNRLKLDFYLNTDPVIQDQDSLRLWKTVVQSNHKWERVGLVLLFVLSLPVGMLVGGKSGFVTVDMGIVFVVWVLHLVLNAWSGSSQDKMKELECSDETANAEYRRVCKAWGRQLSPDFKIEQDA
ncbi:hypothetical protein Pan241w_22640 [Gimesia alba]|uniref:Uncharacterized protein n=1 Tax=Gimesia alba TaxID=2527973 RepID=A0A517RE88_9PLAN|nr:hypothetical protein [Gimesia alba]QDT42183.1 hypothetical protein Pan241w_22640 [Gimesia alba]